MTWQHIEQKLESDLSADIFNLWIKPLQCKRFDRDIVELSGPDKFFCSWVADNYMSDLKIALADHGKDAAKIIFSVNRNSSKKNTPLTSPTGKQQLSLPTIQKKNTFVRALNPKYVFDEFVVGDSNAVAHSACHAMANGDNTLGQCLYISSATGLGKSHLSHAVAHQVLSVNPNVRLNYLTAQQLSAEMVRSIQARKMESFKEKFQNSDILLMEDMQSLTGKTKTQEELSLFLDILLESGKTVIFTGGHPPKDIKDLDSGLRSRMSSGLITTITEPDLQTRFMITEKQAKSINLDLTEELALYLAEKVKGDIRQLKSAIVGLKAKSNIRGSQPDLDMVKEVLSTLINQRLSMTPSAIRDYIADQYKVSIQELQSKSRKKHITFPRQMSMYFSRKYTETALSEIGKAFNRDHSTVVHSIKVITDAIVNNASIKGQVDLLDKKITKHFL